MQPETNEVNNGAAERQRRYRARKRQGVVCIARVPVYALDVEMLVARNRIKPDDQSDAAKIAEAIEALVDDFTEGKLIAASI
ncbi:MAG: hypothetical protein O7I42_22400 [Alphaproteobacteria bacterium]|nr:hypothetical protein [Alphaproteobacteria bacterium]